MPHLTGLPPFQPRSIFAGLLLPILSGLAPVHAENIPSAEPTWEAVLPSIKSKCVDCHGGKKTKAGLDLKRLESDPSVLQEYDLWTKVQDAVKSGDMPPDDAKPLADSDRKKLLKWLDASLDKAANTNSGDPGAVTLRRLTNAEFDNSIRDLTGIDFRFGKDFVPDGGGGEGFSNIGDALFVSPQQLDKVFAAARKISEHATILPGTGIRFFNERLGVRGPAQLRSDAEAALFVWYQKMAEPFLPKDEDDLREGEYMLACWKWKNKDLTGAASLESLAKEANLNLPFLENWWSFFQSQDPKSRFLDLTRLPWKELPGPDPAAPKVVPPQVQQKITEIETQLKSWGLPKKWSVLRAQQDSDELKTHPFEAKINGEKSIHLVVGDLGDGNRGDYVTVTDLEIWLKGGKKESYITWITTQRDADQKQLDSIKDDAAKVAEKAPLEARIKEAENFLGLLGKHPLNLQLDAKALVLQAPVVLTLPVPEGAQRFHANGKMDIRVPDNEFASLQWIATAGTPPDPTKIIPGVIVSWKRQTKTQHEIGEEFQRMRNVFPEDLLHRLNEVASNRWRGGKAGKTIYYFSDPQLASLISPSESQRLPQFQDDWKFLWNKVIPKNLEPEWDKKVLAHLESFASKAWRRPLTEEEKTQIKTVYQTGITQELDRESAAREVLVRTLVAPAFLFKLEQIGAPGIHPVTPLELASRLSYFIWSSIPDSSLLQKAADGALTNPDVLKAEALRMLKDPRAKAMAREFAAQWFEFQNFDATTKVDTAKFPEFTPELRNDLYQESMTFLSYVIQENRPVSEIITADYSFLNERLAKHYGIPDVKGDELRQLKVSDYSRGGLLGMGALLTKTSYPHRTSPVLRGNWLLHTVLGTPTPAPPNNVPKLDESVAAAKSLRERLERHRLDKACAVCHERLDPLGFALEGFDPIGRVRKTDDTGSPVDDSGQDKEGHKFVGVNGLKAYLKSRDTEFYALFSKKLLGYALGRKVLPTDKQLLEQMKKQLQSNDPTFSGAVVSVIQSPQFLNRRGE